MTTKAPKEPKEPKQKKPFKYSEQRALNLISRMADDLPGATHERDGDIITITYNGKTCVACHPTVGDIMGWFLPITQIRAKLGIRMPMFGVPISNEDAVRKGIAMRNRAKSILGSNIPDRVVLAQELYYGAGWLLSLPKGPKRTHREEHEYDDTCD